MSVFIMNDLVLKTNCKNLTLAYLSNCLRENIFKFKQLSCMGYKNTLECEFIIFNQAYPIVTYKINYLV